MVLESKSMKSVNFEVVELWYNIPSIPYTLIPESDKSVKNYAIKVGDCFFLLGSVNNSVHVCDYEARI